MSTDYEDVGLRSEAALTLASHIRRKANLANPESWIAEVEARAITAFISHMSAEYRKHSASAVREDMIVACARFGVKPEWFVDDDDDDPTFVRELRADVAHYRIMHGLDE